MLQGRLKEGESVGLGLDFRSAIRASPGRSSSSSMSFSMRGFSCIWTSRLDCDRSDQIGEVVVS